MLSRAAPLRRARTRRRARPASIPAAAPTAPTGYRASRPTIWSRTRASRGPVSAESSSARASALGQTLDHAAPGSPAKSSLGLRAASTKPTDSACQPARDEREHLRRGAIEPLLVIHHADQRLLLGHVGEQGQDGQGDEESIRRRPGTDARTRSAAHRAAGPGDARGDPASAPTAGAVPANASSISDWTPAARATRQPDACSTRYSNSAVLPTPGSPQTTSARLSPARTASISRVQNVAFAAPAP